MNVFAVAAMLSGLYVQLLPGIIVDVGASVRSTTAIQEPRSDSPGEMDSVSALDFNIKIVSVHLPPLVLPGDVVTPRVAIRNIGSQTENIILHTCIVEAYGRGDTVYRSSARTSVEASDTIAIDCESWVAAEGEYIVLVTIRNQSNAEQYTDGVPVRLDVLWRQPRERVIIELFTALWCPVCPGATLGVNELYLRNEPIIVVACHLSDAFATPEGARKAYDYGVYGVPTAIFNGGVKLVGGNFSVGYVMQYLPVVDSIEQIGSPLHLSVTVGRNESCTFAHTTITSLSPIRNPNLVLEAVITESHIPYKWRGQSELNHVLRSFSVDKPECAVDLTDRIEQVDLVLTNLGPVNLDRSELLVYVRDKVTREIYDGTTIQLRLVMAPIRPPSANDGFDVYPNPASTGEVLRIELMNDRAGELEIFDVLGRPVLERRIGSEAAIPTDGFPAGLYFLWIRSETRVHFEKLLIR